MKKIGGNITAEIKVRSVIEHESGEQEPTFSTVHTLKGFLDSSGGDSKYTSYNAKIQESTHLFICDYQELSVTAENSIMVIKGKTYDILLIDNPQELNYQLEIFLKFVGGQNG